MRKKIGELLVDMGATTADEVKNALGHQRAHGGLQRLGQVLVSMGTVTPEQIAKALSLQFDVPFIDLPEIPSSVSSLVPIEVQSEHRVIPFRLESDGKVERLHLAVADPSDLGLVEDIRFQLGKQVKIWVASSSDIDEVLRALRGESMAEFDPIEIEEDAGILELEQPVAPPLPPRPTQSPPAPAPEAPAAPVLDLPPEWDFPEPLPPSPTPAAATAAGLDALLAESPRKNTPSRPVEVVKFAAAAKPAKVEPEPKSERLDFSEQDLAILENIERMADGAEPDLDSSRVRPAQMVASLIRLLIRKGVILEGEFLEELSKK